MQTRTDHGPDFGARQMSDDDPDEARREQAVRVAKAVREVVAQFQGQIALDTAISGVVWALADLMMAAPESCRPRLMAQQVGILLRQTIEARRARDKPQALH